MVDNGYIVYVGKGEAARADDAQFKAEGLALEDLANECSMIPKGTRVEDRFTEQTKSGYTTYTKIALELQECDEAQKTADPAEIRKIANVNFTDQLKKYQDMEETGFRGEAEDEEEITPPTEIAAAPAQGSYPPNVHFYVTRQYVAYEKEVVVLSPPTAYQPGSVESTQFAQHVVPAQANVASMEMREPTLKTNPTPWSQLPNRPKIERPATLQKAAQHARTRNERRMNAPRPSQGHEPQKRNGGGGRKKRRREAFGH